MSNILHAVSGASPHAHRVAEVLGCLYGGQHNVPHQRKTDWTDRHYIRVVLPHELATADADRLTRLVFLAHDYGMRVGVRGAANGYLAVEFWQRNRSTSIMSGHKTLADAVALHRSRNPEEDVLPAQLVGAAS